MDSTVEQPHMVVSEEAKYANGHSLETKISSQPLSTLRNSAITPENATVDGSTNPVLTPFIHPSSASSSAAPRVLTPDQEKKYASLLKTAQSWTTIPTNPTSSTPQSPVTDSERMWLSRECLLRYLRASKWNLSNAITRLEATLVWRREYGVESHTADYISEENATGKQVILGYDNECRPCLYMNPHLQNTPKTDRQIEHMVFMIERCIDILPAGQETLALLINFKDTRKGQGATVGQGRQALNILQNHYPERLGRACVKNVPWIIWGFFKIITPFIDPLTKEKLKFDEDLRKLVPPTQLLNTYGGDLEFVYDHSAYWPALNGLAEERRKEMQRRWEAAGKKVGESEAYLKGVGEDVGGDVEGGKIVKGEATASVV